MKNKCFPNKKYVAQSILCRAFILYSYNSMEKYNKETYFVVYQRLIRNLCIQTKNIYFYICRHIYTWSILNGPTKDDYVKLVTTEIKIWAEN